MQISYIRLSIVALTFFLVGGWARSELQIFRNKNKKDACAAAVLSISQPFDFEVNHYGLRYRGKSHDYMDGALLGCGSWEAGYMRFLIDILHNLKKDSEREVVAIDVGAHRGTHTLVYSTLASKVIAVEPNPTVFADLKENIRINTVTNVLPLQMGLGDSEGSIPFYVPHAHHTGVGSFSADHSDNVENSTRKVLLPITTGDALVAEYVDTPITFIKIDVEGFEKKVILGFVNTLKRDRPFVFFEYAQNIEDSFESVHTVKDHFPADYAFFEVDEENMADSSFVVKPLGSSTTDKVHIFAFPQEKSEQIAIQGVHLPLR